MMNKHKMSDAASCLIVILTVIGTVVMLTNKNNGILAVYGIDNLKFFTVESNLLLGIAHLLFVLLSGGWNGQPVKPRLWLERLLFIATTATSLTFTIVVLFFGPMLGYAELFQGGNLYFHLIIPLLGIVSLSVFHRNRRIPMWETAAAMIPSVLYGLYYTAVLLFYGVHFPETDWYGFAAGGVIGSILTASAIFLTTWVLSAVLRLVSGGTGSRQNETQDKVR